MKIQFDGAAQTVTGSMHLLEVNGSKLLLECGLYQGPRNESYERNRNFPFDVRTIDAVILSHAHIDHSGNLPNLVKQGYAGPIYAIQATCHLADLMLRDSGYIQEKQADNINYHREKRGEPPVEPLYTQADAEQVTPLLKAVPYDSEFEPVPGVIAKLVEAGHILGSAAVVLDVDEKDRKKRRVWFSGDIGRRDLPILRDPVLPQDADILIMESTYGDKPHRDPEEAYVEMRDVIRKTLDRGGKVIVPCFAVGRTQELVYNLSRMYDEGDLPHVPVYVDSPLAVNASKIFREHPECFDTEMLELIHNGHPALEFKLLTYVHELDESKALNERKDPMIIISASGMAEVGRIVYHIRWGIENPRNTIMIVSWQAPHTLGRRLADREKKVRIFGDTYRRRAEVATIGGLSAHAGQNMLTEYGTKMKGRGKKVFLVHGEKKPVKLLKEKLVEGGVSQVYYPGMQSVVEI